MTYASSNTIPICTHCGSPLTGSIAMLNGAPYHHACAQAALARALGVCDTPSAWADRCPDIPPSGRNGRVIRKQIT